MTPLRSSVAPVVGSSPSPTACWAARWRRRTFVPDVRLRWQATDRGAVNDPAMPRDNDDATFQFCPLMKGEPAMHSPARRAAKALPGLVVAAGLALAADPPGRAASTGEGATEKHIFSQKLPNVPGKTLTVIEVEYRPGGFSAPHRHPASGFVYAYVLSGTIRSQVEGEPLGVYSAGQSWTEPPNAHHIVSSNASKTEPARLIAYIIADDGAEATVYDK